MEKKLTISTLMNCDFIGHESIFPNNNISGSSGKRFQDVYWKCCYNFFSTSLIFNSNCRHVLFTNILELPVVDGVNLKEWFNEKKIEVITIPFTFIPPIGFCDSFISTFFKFDVLKYIASEKNNDNDYYLILDSDCLWTQSAQKILDSMKKDNLLVYDARYSPEHVISGLTRKDYKDLFCQMGVDDIGNDVPSHFGAEFTGGSKAILSLVYNELPSLWSESLKRFNSKKLYFKTEEHFFSFIFYKLGFRKDTASLFVKRMWTNPLGRKPKNVDFDDLNLPVWHLPAEKNFGLDRLFELLTSSNNLNINKMNDSELRDFLAIFFGLPKRSFYLMSVNIFKKIKLKFFNN